jgi:tetratricopeptide (TPR) repeat protein
LVRLLETGEYQVCLKEALALLDTGTADDSEQARIYGAICRCRLELGNSREAEMIGLHALSLAEALADADLLAPILVDIGTARMRLRRFGPALEAWEQYERLLPQMTGARCREGFVSRQKAEALQGLGQIDQALAAYAAAGRWFDRFGDAASARACQRAMIAIHLERGDLKRVRRLLAEGDRVMPGAEAAIRTDHLLDWACYLLASGRPALAAARAFAVLDQAASLDQQGRAQMILCQAALQQEKPVEAFAFALAARVSAIEGSHYSLEFDAAEVIFRLLRLHGSELLDEVAADFERQGVNIYDYLSELAVRRCLT